MPSGGSHLVKGLKAYGQDNAGVMKAVALTDVDLQGRGADHVVLHARIHREAEAGVREFALHKRTARVNSAAAWAAIAHRGLHCADSKACRIAHGSLMGSNGVG